MDYDETSQEVITTIAMVKSMTTSTRRRSTLTKSPLLPQINNRKDTQRGSLSNAGMFVNSSSVVTSSKTSSWPTRGVTLASIEFKKKLEKRKTRNSKEDMTADMIKRSSIPGRANFNEKESARLTVLKSIFSNDGKTSNIGGCGTVMPIKRSSESKKSLPSLKSSPSNFTPIAQADRFSKPLLSVAKITPLQRPTFPHQRSRAHTMKWQTTRTTAFSAFINCFCLHLHILSCVFLSF